MQQSAVQNSFHKWVKIGVKSHVFDQKYVRRKSFSHNRKWTEIALILEKVAHNYDKASLEISDENLQPFSCN
jgi:hypothetical protein